MGSVFHYLIANCECLAKTFDNAILLRIRRVVAAKLTPECSTINRTTTITMNCSRPTLVEVIWTTKCLTYIIGYIIIIVNQDAADVKEYCCDRW